MAQSGELRIGGGYSAAALDHGAERVRIWSMGRERLDARRVGTVAGEQRPRDICVYFDNDVKVKASYYGVGRATRGDEMTLSTAACYCRVTYA